MSNTQRSAAPRPPEPLTGQGADTPARMDLPLLEQTFSSVRLESLTYVA